MIYIYITLLVYFNTTLLYIYSYLSDHYFHKSHNIHFGKKKENNKGRTKSFYLLSPYTV